MARPSRRQAAAHERPGAEAGASAKACNAREAADIIARRQIEQPINIRWVEKQQNVQHLGRYIAALVNDKAAQQRHIVEQHKEQPHADGDAAGRPPDHAPGC